MNRRGLAAVFAFWAGCAFFYAFPGLLFYALVLAMAAVLSVAVYAIFNEGEL